MLPLTPSPDIIEDFKTPSLKTNLIPDKLSPNSYIKGKGGFSVEDVAPVLSSSPNIVIPTVKFPQLPKKFTPEVVHKMFSGDNFGSQNVNIPSVLINQLHNAVANLPQPILDYGADTIFSAPATVALGEIVGSLIPDITASLSALTIGTIVAPIIAPAVYLLSALPTSLLLPALSVIVPALIDVITIPLRIMADIVAVTTPHILSDLLIPIHSLTGAIVAILSIIPLLPGSLLRSGVAIFNALTGLTILGVVAFSLFPIILAASAARLGFPILGLILPWVGFLLLTPLRLLNDAFISVGAHGLALLLIPLILASSIPVGIVTFIIVGTLLLIPIMGLTVLGLGVMSGLTLAIIPALITLIAGTVLSILAGMVFCAIMFFVTLPLHLFFIPLIIAGVILALPIATLTIGSIALALTPIGLFLGGAIGFFLGSFFLAHIFIMLVMIILSAINPLGLILGPVGIWLNMFNASQWGGASGITFLLGVPLTIGLTISFTFLGAASIFSLALFNPLVWGGAIFTVLLAIILFSLPLLLEMLVLVVFPSLVISGVAATVTVMVTMGVLGLGMILGAVFSPLLLLMAPLTILLAPVSLLVAGVIFTIAASIIMGLVATVVLTPILLLIAGTITTFIGVAISAGIAILALGTWIVFPLILSLPFIFAPLNAVFGGLTAASILVIMLLVPLVILTFSKLMWDFWAWVAWSIIPGGIALGLNLPLHSYVINILIMVPAYLLTILTILAASVIGGIAFAIIGGLNFLPLIGFWGFMALVQTILAIVITPALIIGLAVLFPALVGTLILGIMLAISMLTIGMVFAPLLLTILAAIILCGMAIGAVILSAGAGIIAMIAHTIGWFLISQLLAGILSAGTIFLHHATALLTTVGLSLTQNVIGRIIGRILATLMLASIILPTLLGALLTSFSLIETLIVAVRSFLSLILASTVWFLHTAGWSLAGRAIASLLGLLGVLIIHGAHLAHIILRTPIALTIGVLASVAVSPASILVGTIILALIVVATIGIALIPLLILSHFLKYITVPLGGILGGLAALINPMRLWKLFTTTPVWENMYQNIKRTKIYTIINGATKTLRSIQNSIFEWVKNLPPLKQSIEIIKPYYTLIAMIIGAFTGSGLGTLGVSLIGGESWFLTPIVVPLMAALWAALFGGAASQKISRIPQNAPSYTISERNNITLVHV